MANVQYEFESNLNINKPVDIIIPIYNAYDEVVACVSSLLTNTTHPYRLILIDDASTDNRIKQYLDDLNNRDIENVLILYNEKNLGFVGTVNRGLGLSESHVVLLNSDTEVPMHWLERLLSPIYQDSRIGTVTPFSNNATICSFPNFCQDNDLPAGFDVNSLDAVFSRWAPEVIIDIPTAVGFCMLISKQCLDSVGLLDEATFGRGYGEENDFCMRALERGFRNVLCPNLFVYHKGSMSFGIDQKPLLQENLKKLGMKHPTYFTTVEKFIAEDPISPVRKVIQSGANICGSSKKGLLFVLHSWGGGTETHVEDVIKEISDDFRIYVLTARSGTLDFVDRSGDKPLIYSFSEQLLAESDSWLTELCAKFAIDLVHIHHVIGFPEEFFGQIRSLNIPYIFTGHDFYPVCPSYTLLNQDSKYCEAETNTEKCDFCLKKQNTDINIVDWRNKWSSILDGAKLVITPSESAAEIYKRYFPKVEIRAIEHGTKPFDISPEIKPELTEARDALRVALLGAIGPHKGSLLLEELVQKSRSSGLAIQWIVIGYTNIHPNPFKSPDEMLIVHGKYETGEIPQLLNHYRADLVLLPAIWPETYSYTLSEAWLAGYPVMGPDLGAIGERLAKTGAGWVLPDIKSDTILKKLSEFMKTPEELIEAKERVRGVILPDIHAMGEKYLSIYQTYRTEAIPNAEQDIFSANVLYDAAKTHIILNPMANPGFLFRVKRKTREFLKVYYLKIKRFMYLRR